MVYINSSKYLTNRQYYCNSLSFSFRKPRQSITANTTSPLLTGQTSLPVTWPSSNPSSLTPARQFQTGVEYASNMRPPIRIPHTHPGPLSHFSFPYISILMFAPRNPVWTMSYVPVLPSSVRFITLFQQRNCPNGNWCHLYFRTFLPYLVTLM